MQILTFKIRGMHMRIEAFISSVGTYCIGLGQLNDCNSMLFNCCWIRIRTSLHL